METNNNKKTWVDHVKEQATSLKISYREALKNEAVKKSWQEISNKKIKSVKKEVPIKEEPKKEVPIKDEPKKEVVEKKARKEITLKKVDIIDELKRGSTANAEDLLKKKVIDKYIKLKKLNSA